MLVPRGGRHVILPGNFDMSVVRACRGDSGHGNLERYGLFTLMCLVVIIIKIIGLRSKSALSVRNLCYLQYSDSLFMFLSCLLRC